MGAGLTRPLFGGGGINRERAARGGFGPELFRTALAGLYGRRPAVLCL
jgi:hypothetical protein